MTAEVTTEPQAAMADKDPALDKKTIVLRIVVGVALVLLPLIVILALAFFS